jgi:hypothetical protein
MNGELDFAQSLRARVAALEGCRSRCSTRSARHSCSQPGARTLIRTLKRLGFPLRHRQRRLHPDHRPAGRAARAWTSPPPTPSRSPTAG